MRVWLIVGLLALSLGEPVAEQNGKPQKHQEASKPSTAPTAVTPVVTAQPSQAASNPENQRPPKEPEKSCWRRAFGPETLSNWGLFFVGIGGILAALITLGTIRRQTVATEIAANAAKASADALINSERAWLMADLEWPKDSTRRFGWGLAGGAEGATTWATLSLNCSNEGNTPAWIIQKRVRMEIVEPIPSKPQFPPVNPEWEFESSEPEPMAPGKSHSVSFDITCHDKWDTEVESLTNRELIVYGLVKYRDAFQVERETRFGYRFAKSSNAELERIRGFPEYNKHT